MNNSKAPQALNEENLVRLKDQLCFPIYLCAKEITGNYTRALKKLDLTYTQYVVMMYFWNQGSSNLTEITKTLLLDASTLSPIIKKLEMKGFVERKRSEADERNLVISLTPKGYAVKEPAIQATGEVASFFRLTEEEAAAMRSVALKLLQASRNIEV